MYTLAFGRYMASARVWYHNLFSAERQQVPPRESVSEAEMLDQQRADYAVSLGLLRGIEYTCILLLTMVQDRPGGCA